jgi:hypothetical protein
MADGFKIEDLEIIRFSDRYFRSIRGYNKLLTSFKFYKAFEEFEFILLHHPDAFVFRDELEFWCKKNYDLVGPPMYEYDGSVAPKNYIGVGTSGFSLKKVSSHIKILNTFRVIYGYGDILKKLNSYNLNGKIYYLPYFVRLFLGMGNNSHHLLNNLRINDDVVWGVLVKNSFEEFRVPDLDEAKEFGLEFNCSELLSGMNGKLPFGCHQWFKREFLDFWKSKIERQGYTL